MKYFVFIFVLLIGCYSPRFVEKYLDNLQTKNPSVFEKKSSQYYPCGWIVVDMNKRDSIMLDSISRNPN